MTDISVYSLDRDGTVRFSLRNINRQISGPEEALQMVASTMLTEPGSSLYAPADGGGIKAIKAKGIQSKESTMIDCAIMVSRTMSSIRRRQQANDRPANSTVVGLDLMDAIPDRANKKITIKVRIRLQDGNSFTASF